MGNRIFWGLHALAILFCIPALIITVPLHLIYKVMQNKQDLQERIRNLERLQRLQNRPEDQIITLTKEVK